MNKYQEALDKLEYFAVQYENTKTGDQWDEIADEIQSCKKILQELVDKSEILLQVLGISLLK